MVILTEDKTLYRGIFWITDIDNISSSKLYFQIPCDSNGVINDTNFNIDFDKSSKGQDNYNHKKVWNTLSVKDTKGKPYNYFPRGRVEISNNKAIIYCSPHIVCDELKNWIIDKFNLTNYNGIKKIRVIPDYSEHYECYLDLDYIFKKEN